MPPFYPSFRMYFNLLTLVAYLVLLLTQAVSSVTVTYETPHLDSGQYYILDGDSLTLVCQYTDSYIILEWGFRATVGIGAFTSLYSNGAGAADVIQDKLVGRATSELRPADKQHRLTIAHVDLTQDVGEYQCEVFDLRLTPSSAELQISGNDILIKPIGTAMSLPTLVTSNGVVTEGSNTVSCQATFSNTPRVSELTFTLYLDSVSTSGGGTKYPSSGRESTATYTETVDIVRTVDRVKCVMTWQSGKTFGITEETETDITVHFKATSIDMTGNQTGTSPEGSYTFTCTTNEANPIAEVLWYKNGQLINSGITKDVVDGDYGYKQRRSVLTIAVTKSDNQAVIRCAVQGNTGVDVQHILDIKFAPESTSLTPLGTVNAGTPTTAYCTVSSSNPASAVVWRKDRVIVIETGSSLVEGINKGRVVTSVYRFTPQMEDNWETATCTPRWEGSELSGQTKTSTLNVLFGATEIALSASHNDLVFEGTTVTLTCMTDEGNPTPFITWTRSGISPPLSGATHIAIGGNYNAYRRRSVYTISADRSLNNVVYTCTTGSHSDTHTLQVKFPHAVTITLTTHSPIEGDEIALTCEATGGNPSAVNRYDWSFTPRYGNTEASGLESEKILRLTDVVYSSAGTYRCSATNDGGTNSGDREVLIRFAAKDVSKLHQKVSSTMIGNIIQVNCTVLAYPQVITSHVIITYKNNQIPNNRVTVQGSGTDETTIALMFNDPVTAEDFGSYSVIIDNGVGELTIIMDIRESGPPQAPHDLVIDQITAHSANISWVSGRNGGSTQKFCVHYEEFDGSNPIQSAFLDDLGIGVTVTYAIQDLKENTIYKFKVVSENTDKSQNSAESGFIPFATRAVPVVLGQKQALVNGNTITFSWEPIIGYATHVVIEKCDLQCEIVFNTTNTTVSSVQFYGEDLYSYTYQLKVYQHHEMVYENEFLTQIPSNPSRGVNVSTILGIVVGVLIFIILSGTGFVLFFKYKYNFISKKRAVKQPNASGEHTYANQEFHDISTAQNDLQVYEPVKEITPQAPSVYTFLDSSTQQRVNGPNYENVVLQSTNTKVNPVNSQIDTPHEETELNTKSAKYINTQHRADDTIYERDDTIYEPLQ